MKAFDREGLHSIGELSKIVKISTDALRYYDEIGLLAPAFISDQTGYRYYSDSQIFTIARILELKEYGFSLNRIKDILADDSMSPLSEIYKSRYFELLNEKQRIQEAINKISNKIEQQQEVMYMSKSILLVDDANFMRMMCRDFLEKHGYKIAGEAVNGAEAVEKYKSMKPDVVLMDIVMPEMNGIEALNKIKEIDSGARVVMCSAMGQLGMLVEALLAGASDFVVKPFRPDKVIDAVSGALSSERVFDKVLLKRLLEKSSGYEHILSQLEVDEIITCASADKDNNYDIDKLVDKFGNYGKSDKNINNDTGEQEIMRRLDKLEKG